MAKNKKSVFKVPEAERHAFKILVQKANRTIKSNLKYIDKHNVRDSKTIRSLVFNYFDEDNWAKNKKGQRAKSPLSRSVIFSSEDDYKSYVRHLEKMAGRNVKQKATDYREAILDALQRIANKHDVQLPNNKIPQEIVDSVNSMSIEQLENWFEFGDPSDDIEEHKFGSLEYVGVSGYEQFRDITLGRNAWLKRVL